MNAPTRAPRLLDRYREEMVVRHYVQLYRTVLGGDVGSLEGVVRAHRPRRLPVVLSEDEVRRVLCNLNGSSALVGQVLYGSGLRLMEALRLRIKDMDFEKSSIIVRDGKGHKDRITVLPESLKTPLKAHFREVWALHQTDLSDGWGRVVLPGALARKYVNAAREWGWQWVFPNSIDGGIETVENRDATTWIQAWFKKRCVQLCRLQG